MNTNFVPGRCVFACFLTVALGALSASAEMNSAQILIQATHGQAEYSLDHATWQPLQPGQNISQGAELRTSTDSTADLVLKSSGTVLRLAADSVLDVVKLNAIATGEDVITETSLSLQSGCLIGSQHKLSKPSTFDIVTPNSTATIKGTEYAVKSDGSVSCFSGVVAVTTSKAAKSVPSGTTYSSATASVAATSSATLASLAKNLGAVQTVANQCNTGCSKPGNNNQNECHVTPTKPCDDNHGGGNGGNNGNGGNGGNNGNGGNGGNNGNGGKDCKVDNNGKGGNDNNGKGNDGKGGKNDDKGHK